jgi:hypothetical protein
MLTPQLRSVGGARQTTHTRGGIRLAQMLRCEEKFRSPHWVRRPPELPRDVCGPPRPGCTLWLSPQTSLKAVRAQALPRRLRVDACAAWCHTTHPSPATAHTSASPTPASGAWIQDLENEICEKRRKLSRLRDTAGDGIETALESRVQGACDAKMPPAPRMPHRRHCSLAHRAWGPDAASKKVSQQ